MKNTVLAGLLLLGCCFAGQAAAELQLYPTGPKDVVFKVRFVNATDSPVSVVGADKVELSAKAEGRVSDFFKIKVDTRPTMTFQGNGAKVSVNVSGKQGEYVTIVVTSKGNNQLEARIIREEKIGSSDAKASLAVFNLDGKCSGASLKTGAQKKATPYSNIKPFAVQRELIPPVKLTVATLACGEQDTPVDFPQFEKGERYSVLLMALKGGRQAVFVGDEK